MKKLILPFAFMALSLSASSVTPLWMRDIQISPDGTQIAFTYKGDIFTVPATGGSATRVTSTPSYESNPVWSPDSKQIAFASDRNGNFDVYIVPATGGTATRLTTNSAAELPDRFTPDGKYVIFTGHIQDPTKSVQFPTARLTELYKVPVKGGNSTLFTAAPAEMISFSPDGKFIVYQDIKGMEDQWRKHHTSSITRDIWRFDIADDKFTNLTDHAGEDRNPVLSRDGKTVYFLSERDGKSMNVYSFPIDNPQEVTEITNFKTHPVRFLSQADNGTFAMGYDGEIYTMGADKKPKKVKIDIVMDEAPQIERIAIRPTSASVSPDGKQTAFISRGDLFVASNDYSSVKQISNTPQAESQVSWSPDGKTLVYTSERDGHWNLYTAKIANDSDPNFSNATIIEETPLFNDNRERTYPTFSPDGKKLGFIQDRTKVMIMDVDSKKVKQLTDGSTVTRMTGGVPFTFSPDGKWILTEVVDRKHDPYTDIAIINVEDGSMHNLTQTGYFDSDPRWVMDGNAILFTSDRDGLRAHASWGSQTDAYIVFLNRETFDKFNLSEEEYEIFKEAEKKDKKEKDAKDKDGEKDNKSGKKADKKEVKPINVELDGINHRTIKLTPFSSDISDLIITKYGESLYFITTTDNDPDLWKINLRKGEPKMVSRNIGRGGLEMDKDGKIYVVGRKMKRIDPKSDKITNISISGSQDIDRAAERDYMFNYVKTQERERFYTPDMHGVNWDKMTADYSKFLPHINNNYDFAEMLSELLGELNVSHTGGRYSHAATGAVDRTSSLGLLYDMSYTGNGFKVDEVVAGGPFDRASSKVAPGCIILKINGKEINSQADQSELMNNISGKNTLVTIKNPATGEVWDETVKPISAGKMNNLLYQRWVEARAADVDRWSNGRLGYVHIKSMNDGSYRPVYADVLGKYNDREGIVIDIRHNGGGRLHEDVEVFFSGKKYLTQVVRGKETCDMPSRRWNKPSIMLQCEACYSNAHGTPWVYKTMGLGKLVGMPVPGTMTSVNWVTMQDPSMVFGIPVVGYRTAEGNYLENTQLEPDVKVPVNPANVIKGDDLQLKAAVETLLHDLDAAK
ncbi:MAG: peptidase S41 [Muribaculaceae bacterium]|nr:peptidase S41 [Muribaculaceae bacterium]